MTNLLQGHEGVWLVESEADFYDRDGSSAPGWTSASAWMTKRISRMSTFITI